MTSQNTDGNREVSNFLSRPYWLSDDGLKKGEIDVLSLQEEQFWKDLLEKYLYPIDEDKAEKVNTINLKISLQDCRGNFEFIFRLTYSFLFFAFELNIGVV